MKLPRLLCVAVSLWSISALGARADQPAPLVSDTRVAELRAATGLSADDQLELALALDERGDAKAAVDHYTVAAQAGIGAAELRLGAMIEVGHGAVQDYVLARTHYERAVAAGVAEANLRLGLLYLEGWGVTADAATAVTCIERAAAAGYGPAQKILSDMYFAGVKVPQDLAKALTWAERAAAKSDPEALTRVGALRQAVVKLPQDLQLAREWYQLSAEQDYTRGMLGMASTFFRPGADAATIALGIRWLDLAAEGGNSAAAFFRAGAWLRLGPQTTKADEAKARALFDLSAKAGEASAKEVLQLDGPEWPLWKAFAYVMTVPYDVRYVQRLKDAAPPGTAGTRPPRPLKIVQPIYPAALRLTGVEGEAMVEFVVDTTGRVRNAHTISSTHPGFAEAAAAAVAQGVFLPAMKDGRVVNTRMRLPIYFQLSDVSAPSRWSNSAPGDQPGAKGQ